jgi:hypothetical protein
VGAGVGVAVGAGVAIGVAVGVGAGVGVAVGAGVAVGVAVGVGAGVGVAVGVAVGAGVDGTTVVRLGGASGTREKSARLFCVLTSMRSTPRRRSIIVVDDIAGVGVPKPPALDVALPQETASATVVVAARWRSRIAPPVAAIPSLHDANAPAEKLPRPLATRRRAPAASGVALSKLAKRRVVVPLAVV